MKPTLLLLIAAILFSCNNKAENKTTAKDSASKETVIKYDRTLVGKWRIINMGLPSDSASKQAMIDHAVIEFTGDGKITTVMKEKTTRGTYLFSEQDSKLTTTMEEGKVEIFDLSWDKENLLLTTAEGTVVLKRQ